MSNVRLGIGVVTHNRRKRLADTLVAIAAHTTSPHTLVVADDGSTDGTADWCRSEAIPVIGGQNRGVAWNKNRALWYLFHCIRCDVVILLEDDSYPSELGWERDWICAAQMCGHINLAGEWFKNSWISGAGTVTDPVLSKRVSGQCAAFSREAIAYGGYFDSRFVGYGYGHIEHTRRLIRLGYGGKTDITGVPLYALLRSPISVDHVPGAFNGGEQARNLDLMRQMLSEQTYRAPWQNDDELAALREEIGLAEPSQ